VERGVSIDRVTVVPPLAGLSRQGRAKRKRAPPVLLNPRKEEEKKQKELLQSARRMTIAENLQQGYSNNKTKGWRRRELDRAGWLQEAVLSELEARLPRVAVALVQATKFEGGLEKDGSSKRRVWSKEVGECAALGAVECARALHELVLTEFSGRRDVWLAFAKFEKALVEQEREKDNTGNTSNNASGDNANSNASCGIINKYQKEIVFNPGLYST